ncbi:hypothetical protein DCAR_0831022 [Daucus carota subsp. sativus]|uniref:Uncharacterized protein n=1 Tax=Daucus carota subsp. sativus TaxID=79200 RepID=A0A175YM75_DAUCS|nr:PREDICTED: F-box/kelch-repeat protein At3g06240-like [Daucus carota subsp. sativus]WOH11535.1 hypothetical protein DCAR_0831022 [Daucus carota subsp. sativus]
MATTPPRKTPRLPENEPTYREPPQLPEDIILTKILTRLPAKIVGRLRSVCKPWRSLLSKPSFTKDHLNCTTQNPDEDNLIINKFVTNSNRKYYEIDVLSLSDLSETKLFDQYEFQRDYPVIKLIGSIYGIVCLYINVRDRAQFVLWNPVIKQAKEIESPECDIDLCGFCWDEVEADFKVIACSYRSEGRFYSVGLVYVYSCKSDSWTMQADARSWQPGIRFCDDYDEVPHSGVPAAIVNGVPYWQYSQRFEAGKPVFKFEVGSGEFREVPKPDVVGVSDKHEFLIVNWKERLSALVTQSYFSLTVVDVYCFDEGSGVWSKMHNIGPNMSNEYKLLGCFKYGGEIVTDINGNYVCYDYRTGETKGLGNRKGRLLTGFSHKDSLVFLEGMKRYRNATPYLLEKGKNS